MPKPDQLALSPNPENSYIPPESMDLLQQAAANTGEGGPSHTLVGWVHIGDERSELVHGIAQDQDVILFEHLASAENKTALARHLNENAQGRLSQPNYEIIHDWLQSRLHSLYARLLESSRGSGQIFVPLDAHTEDPVMVDFDTRIEGNAAAATEALFSSSTNWQKMSEAHLLLAQSDVDESRYRDAIVRSQIGRIHKVLGNKALRLCTIVGIEHLPGVSPAFAEVDSLTTHQIPETYSEERGYMTTASNQLAAESFVSETLMRRVVAEAYLYFIRAAVRKREQDPTQIGVFRKMLDPIPDDTIAASLDATIDMLRREKGSISSKRIKRTAKFFAQQLNL